ncbi:MAG: helix-turn-helix domain-containing protein [Janthinobacterium lividum]
MKKTKPTRPAADTGTGPAPVGPDDRQQPLKGFTASGKKIGRPRTRPIVESKPLAERKNKGGRPVGTGGKYTRYKETFTPVPEDAVPMNPELAVQLERSIGLKIAQYRQSQGYTAKDVAERLGVHQSQLSAMEVGRRRMTLPVLYRIASILQVPISELFPTSGEGPLTIAVLEQLAQDVHMATKALLRDKGADTLITVPLLRQIVELILRSLPTGS